MKILEQVLFCDSSHYFKRYGYFCKVGQLHFSVLQMTKIVEMNAKS